jgi:hypothetical protein
MKLDHDLFVANERVSILGTDVTATILRRMPKLCAGCGKPVYLVNTEEGEQFPCCEPGLLRLRLN